MRKIQTFLSRWRVRLGHLFTLVLLFFAQPDAVSLIAGAAVAVLGESIRILSAGYIEKSETLSRSGPYSFTRNPLYLGSFFMYLGFCIASHNLYIAAAFFPFFFAVYLPTIFLEEEFLSKKFGDDFKEYAASVPRFFPCLICLLSPSRRSPLAAHRFQWHQVIRNREYEGMLGLAIVLIILLLELLFGFSPYNLIF
ncbi:MAG: isoprenylcysteine carboxylmethyltransferase family protein [bacterium]